MTLEAEIRAFENTKAELERKYTGKFVLFKDELLIGAYDSLNKAAAVATRRYGRGPYLIRKVGENSGRDSISALLLAKKA